MNVVKGDIVGLVASAQRLRAMETNGLAPVDGDVLRPDHTADVNHVYV